jgi:hypothetical protein
MKNYFNRLKEHPGLNLAFVMTLLGALAGASNTSFQNPIHGILFGIAVTFIACWLPVLISNFRK